MHRIFSLLALSLFILEEIFHRQLGKTGRLPPAPTDEQPLKSSFDRFDLLRLLELLVLSLLLSTRYGNPAAGQGQLSLALVGLQIARLFGRRILSRWSVLGVLQSLEMVFLLAIVIMPAKPAAGYSLSSGSMLAFSGGILFSILSTIIAAFSISYGIRLFARESKGLYETFPPLVSSELWALKFSRHSLYAGAAGLTGLLLLMGLCPLSALFSVSLSLQFAGVYVCSRETCNGHHPVAHILWGISFLILFVLTVSGVTTVNVSL